MILISCAGWSVITSDSLRPSQNTRRRAYLTWRRRSLADESHVWNLAFDARRDEPASYEAL
jgi:hypothetical protein